MRAVGPGMSLFFKNHHLPVILCVAQPNEGLGDARSSSPITGMQEAILEGVGLAGAGLRGEHVELRGALRDRGH